MILSRYRNELIVLASLFLLLGALAYKSAKVSSSIENKNDTKYAVQEFKSLIAMKKRWGDKKISVKIAKLKTSVTESKVSWHKKSKKLEVSYKGLTPKELNKVVTTILNLAVQINLLSIERKQNLYDVEFKCKW